MCLLPAGLPSLHCLIQEGLGSVEVVEEGRGTGSGVKIAQGVKRKKGEKGAKSLANWDPGQPLLWKLWQTPRSAQRPKNA